MNVFLPHVGLFADGTAVAQIGELPFEMVRLQKSDNQAQSLILNCYRQYR
jgi:threonine dehydratase